VNNNEVPIQRTNTGTALTFRWNYIILPLVFLLLAIILTAVFYAQLPVEIAYRFQADGSAYSSTGRGMVILWTLLPQLLLVLLAGGTTWGITRLIGQYIEPGSTGLRPEIILRLIGNMIALPQAILCFAMLDIFLYNAYQIHLLPVWVIALIFLGLGGIVLGVFFIRVMIQAWRAKQ
jgi:uncharacterized membrane protein